MTEKTVSQAVEQRDNGPGAMIKQYEGDFATVAPAHIKPATFVRLGQGVLRRDKKLADAARKNPGSLLSALLDCARLGHEPGTEAFYLVPFGNEVTGIEGYRGQVERMYRAGAVASVKAEVVYANDQFDYDPAMDRPVHKIDWFADDRGDMKLVYAYAVMHDGSTSKVVVMNQKKVNEHKAMSKSANASDSPWKKWPEAMWLKTAVHELEKWVPTSAEFRREQLRAAAEADSARSRHPAPDLPPHDPGTGEIHDAEIVDPDEQAAAEHAEEQARDDAAAEAS